jgi:putative phosphoribosyl transferase
VAAALDLNPHSRRKGAGRILEGPVRPVRNPAGIGRHVRGWGAPVVLFRDRVEAGQRLAERLAGVGGAWSSGSPVHPAAAGTPVVLGLPRGGVPVAAEVAAALHAPLDIVVVRKLGVPSQPELAMGAIGEDGTRILQERVLERARVSAEEQQAVEARERDILRARTALLRGGRRRVELSGRTAVLVDDGIATGATARVACLIARHLGAGRVLLAVPVGPADSVRRITEADEVICLAALHRFRSVGEHYADFSPVEDSEVIALLDAAAGRSA